MEESEKRRERLRALQMEAAQADASNYVETSSPNHLSNPLIETSPTVLEQSEPFVTRRFDFYTDPMSAFSSSKKRGKIGNQTAPDNYISSSYNTYATTCVSSEFSGLRNPELSPSPAHQFHGNSPMFYARAGSGSPTTTARPFPVVDQGSPDMYGWPRNPSGNNFPSPLARGMNYPSPNFISGPETHSYTNSMHDMLNYRSRTPSSGFRGSPSPGRGGLGRGGNVTPSSGFRGSPSPGRGGHGRGGNVTPSSRWGSGRGSGSYGRHFSTDRSPRPEQFYDDSVLEDPWKFLEPVIWKTNTWLSKSSSKAPIGTKKVRVSSESSGPSLAEYLATSFNEAVNDAPST